jgi:hypothetical protein
MDRSNFFTRLFLAAAIILVSLVAVGRAADADRQSEHAMVLSQSTKVVRGNDGHAIERYSHLSRFQSVKQTDR